MTVKQARKNRLEKGVFPSLKWMFYCGTQTNENQVKKDNNEIEDPLPRHDC